MHAYECSSSTAPVHPLEILAIRLLPLDVHEPAIARRLLQPDGRDLQLPHSLHLQLDLHFQALLAFFSKGSHPVLGGPQRVRALGLHPAQVNILELLQLQRERRLRGLGRLCAAVVARGGRGVFGEGLEELDGEGRGGGGGGGRGGEESADGRGGVEAQQTDNLVPGFVKEEIDARRVLYAR